MQENKKIKIGNLVLYKGKNFGKNDDLGIIIGRKKNRDNHFNKYIIQWCSEYRDTYEYLVEKEVFIIFPGNKQ